MRSIASDIADRDDVNFEVLLAEVYLLAILVGCVAGLALNHPSFAAGLAGGAFGWQAVRLVLHMRRYG